MKKILFFLWLPLVLQGCDGSLDSNQEELDQFVLDSSIWTVQLGTGTTDSAQGLSIDSQGNLYLAGYTSGDLEGNGNAGGQDLVLVKYNSNGDRQWTRQLGSSGDDVAFASAADSKGNVYAAGYTEGGLDGNTHKGDFDFFLVKYDSNGEKLWSVQDGTSAKDVIFDIADASSFRRSRQALRPNGRYLSLIVSLSILAQMAWTRLTGGRRALFSVAFPSHQDMVRLAELAEGWGKDLYIIVNNKAEGSSPLTVKALAARLERGRRPGKAPRP